VASAGPPREPGGATASGSDRAIDGVTRRSSPEPDAQRRPSNGRSARRAKRASADSYRFMIDNPFSPLSC
jgi:hypothetical protein